MTQIAYLFFLSLLFFGNLSAALEETLSASLSPPYTYFENLYLDIGSETFYTVGGQGIERAALAGFQDRKVTFSSASSTDEIAPAENIEVVPGGTIFLFEAPKCSFLTHFFHLLEHVVGVWSFYGNMHCEDIKQIVLCGKFGKSWKGPNEINRHLFKALFPHAEVFIWDDFLSKYRRQSVLKIEQALTSDRVVTFGLPICRKLNKFLGEAQSAISKDALDTLSSRVNAYALTPLKENQCLKITYLKRPLPRALAPDVEKVFIERLSQIPNTTFHAYDFAKLSFKEQINVIGTTDLLISVHGNGLSHILFLPPHSCVIEIFPPDAHLLDYRLFADVRGIEYFGIISNWGILSREAAYGAGPYGNSNRTITQLNLDLITAIVQRRIHMR